MKNRIQHKLAFLCLPLCLLSCSGLFAADRIFEPLDIHGDWAGPDYVNAESVPRGWYVNPARKEGSYTWVDTDRGRALEIRGNQDAQFPFHIYHSATPFKVDESTTIKGTVTLRGEGELNVSVYLYTANEENVGATKDAILAPGSKEEFIEVPFELTIPPLQKGVPAIARLAVATPPGSRIQIISITASADCQQ